MASVEDRTTLRVDAIEDRTTLRVDAIEDRIEGTGNVYCDLQYDSTYIPTKMERNLLFLAYRLSLESNNKNGRHAAVIIDEQDNILAVGVNSVSTHAEISALLQLKKCLPPLRIDAKRAFGSIRRSRMLVVRGNFFGDFTHSKPCLNCYRSLLNSDIGQIIYSVSNNEYRRIYISNCYQNKKLNN